MDDGYNGIWRCSMDNTTKETAENQVGISIKNLYKIFGATPEKYLDAVKGGTTKQELLDTHSAYQPIDRADGR